MSTSRPYRITAKQPLSRTVVADLRGRYAKVRVVLDRRKDDSRNSPQVTHRLRTHGAVIIRQAP